MHHHHPQRQHVTVPLLRRESIGETYQILTFELPDGVGAQAGQFLMIRGAEWGEAPLLPRPMSYLGGGPTPSVLVKVCGEGTARLGRAEPGEPFTLLGPLGIPWRAADRERRQLLVAGGVGVAPLLFLARDLLAQGLTPLFIYGGRTERDLPLHDDISSLCDVVFATEDGSRGTRGRVTDVLEQVLTNDSEVFTCGPEPMMARVAKIAAGRDVPCAASLEAPMACGYGVCLGCPVPTVDGGYLYACTDGPCVDARRIDWDRAQASSNTTSVAQGSKQ